MKKKPTPPRGQREWRHRCGAGDADEAFGYRRGAGTTAKGRTFYPQISKGF